jgi:PAS domain S-box-containing protein
VVAVVTLHPRTEVETRSFDLGADFFFEKGGNVDEIVQLVEGLSRLRVCLRRWRELREAMWMALASVGSPVAVADARGRIRWTNPAYAALTGFAEDEVRGCVPGLWAAPGGGEEGCALAWEMVMSGRTWSGEVVGSRRDGTRFHAELTVKPRHDVGGAVGQLVAVLRDLSDKNRLLAAAREHEEVVNQASDAIVVADLEGRITFWSDGAKRIFGRTAEEMRGRSVDEFVAPASRARLAAAREMLESGAPWRGELQVVDVERGLHFFLDTRMVVMRDEEGRPKARPKARLSVSSDITRQKSNEELVQRSQRLQSLGLVAAGIAHDLGNLLAPFALALPLLREQTVSPDGEELLRLLEASASRSARLVDQIVAFAKGGGEVAELRLAQIVGEAIGLVRVSLHRGIRLREAVRNDLPPVRGNATQLYQVFFNLCINARDAMPAGGVLQVDADTSDVPAEMIVGETQARPGRFVWVEVSDTGIGIPPEVLPRIWEPFYTTKGEKGGSGLGLMTARGIVRQHGGFIVVRSTPGEGTAFRVYLPAEDAECPGATR